MIVKCSNCDASYTVDDEKVENRKFAFECPKCSSNVVIDNRTGEKELTHDSSLELAAEESEVAASQDQVEDNIDLGIDSDFEDFGEESAIITASAGIEEEEIPLSVDETSPEIELGLDEMNLETEILGDLEDGLSSSLLDEDLSTQAADLEEEGIDDDLESQEAPMQMDSTVEGNEPVVLSSEEEDFSDLTDLDLDDTLADLGEDTSLSSEELELDLGQDDILENLPQDDDILSEDAFSDMPDEELQSVQNIDSSSEKQVSTEEDENITIDLDSLDIDLETEEAGESGLEDKISGVEETISTEDEDSISLDLDALDIDLEESSDINVGETLEEDIEDSRLTIDDAGISMDEISTEFSEKASAASEFDIEHEEDINIEDTGLSIDEISIQEEVPSEISDDDLKLSLDEVAPEIEIGDVDTNELLEDDFETRELPVLDIEQRDAKESTSKLFQLEKDELLQIEDSMVSDEYGEEEFREDEMGKGFINFSIDYSLKHSRLKSFLRLIGLYYLTFIPYIIVNIIYSAVASIVAFINWIVVLFSGGAERDYIRFQEKVLRYSLSIEASFFNLVEEKPHFSGMGNIDYALQLNLVKPVNYSRVLTFLRMTVAGIVLLALPHIILLLILSMGLILIYFIALISILVNGKWPSVLFDFMVRYLRYKASIIAYLSGIIDTYPSFRFD